MNQRDKIAMQKYGKKYNSCCWLEQWHVDLRIRAENDKKKEVKKR